MNSWYYSKQVIECSNRTDHAICSDSLDHFVTLTPTSTPLYHQHQGNGTYYLATSLKRKTLIFKSLLRNYYFAINS